jgi:hypothetical protein
MPLLGTAAMLLLFDVASDAIAEHDDLHTHEHLPERLAIPGFLRGTRWIATHGAPRYMVVYEVAGLATLTSAPYLARLNAPSAWTTRMMPHYRGMRRGFCTVSASVGLGVGNAARLFRFKPRDGTEASLRRWLVEEWLPPLPTIPGVGSAHLLESAATPPMTAEQRIRGADAVVEGVEAAVIVTGYRADDLRGLTIDAARHGAADVSDTMYRLDYSLSAGEVALTSRGHHG